MIHITLTGNLGRAATTKTLTNGRTITTFSLAHTPRFKKNDEWVDGETTWFTVTANGSYSELLLDKGVNVLVTGDLQTKTYTDKETGQDKASLFINADTIAVVARRNPTNNNIPNTTPGNWGTPTPTATPDTDDELMPF